MPNGVVVSVQKQQQDQHRLRGITNMKLIQKIKALRSHFLLDRDTNRMARQLNNAYRSPSFWQRILLVLKK